jgi:hypothetical protein
MSFGPLNQYEVISFFTGAFLLGRFCPYTNPAREVLGYENGSNIDSK